MNDADLIRIVPSSRQLSLQRMEFYAFVHFTVNTFTDREWGDGTEDPSVFNPVNLNADQWVEGIKAAGIPSCILPGKHSDFISGDDCTNHCGNKTGSNAHFPKKSRGPAGEKAAENRTNVS